MTILEKIKFEEDWLSEVNLTKENVKIAFAGIRATALEQQPCEDAISRQTVLQCIKESRDGIDWGQSEDEDAFLHYTAALYRTIASKECFPSVTPEQTSWIPVSEKPQEGRYLCTYEHYDGKCIDFGSFDGKAWYIKPIAYMPLPQPYTEQALEQQPCGYEPFTIAEVSPEMRKLMEEWQQPCTDAISRENVIDEIEFYEINPQHFSVSNLLDDIRKLPSVTPQPKMGKWKYVTHYGRRYRVCSECNCEKEDDRATGWNYCPYCGTRMNGGGEE